MATRSKLNGLRRVPPNTPHWIARGCAKARFPSKKVADARARQIANGMRGYKCPLCRNWHVGHPQ